MLCNGHRSIARAAKFNGEIHDLVPLIRITSPI
jgi:hypothetical protein